MKTNPWFLVLDLIEFEAVPAKTTYMQSNASYFESDFQTNNRLFTQNNRLLLSAEVETCLILEISADLNSFRER